MLGPRCIEAPQKKTLNSKDVTKMFVYCPDLLLELLDDEVDLASV